MTEFMSPVGFNSGYYSNPELDELLAKAPGTADADEFNAIFMEINMHNLYVFVYRRE